MVGTKPVEKIVALDLSDTFGDPSFQGFGCTFGEREGHDLARLDTFFDDWVVNQLNAADLTISTGASGNSAVEDLTLQTGTLASGP